MPSCCCDFESIKLWKNAILSRDSLWLGHDPTPELSFCKDSDVIFLWSDEEGKAGRFSIQFTEQEALVGIEDVFDQLKQFVKKLGEWSGNYTELDRNVVEVIFSIYLMKPLFKKQSRMRRFQAIASKLLRNILG